MAQPLWRCGVFMLALLPLLFWFYQAQQGLLGPDPGKVLLEHLGEGALILMLLTLSLTPLQRITLWSGWSLIRRQLGLWCFCYASLHLMSYLAFLLNFDFSRLNHELWERPYILLGFGAWLILLLLSLTSNAFSRRKLGKNWKLLHRLLYLGLVLALLHLLLILRSDFGSWMLYAGVGLILILNRLFGLRSP
ncbi:sulfoxide reductase heme-binding subunit YedZ [Azomonas agilis]|uniref:Protein-methionine-sulfoxide reductase heme-binding subunit MsrQ n=1 Tax=Azomonas agilis TaxID=116849 RepID=A0A562IY74_9GAMM|nr:ferric reductase-like transmembrane domain-containing protein [Azomonas agilis]TWH75842.1 sulfoxide reductase heme-binding subunit YedZ [Azomonas agilis]